MKNDYEKLKNLSADIYNIASLLTEFCSREEYNEKIANILPVLKYLHNKADKLNCMFINTQFNSKQN